MYDNPIRIRYTFGATPQVALQFGAAGETVGYEFIGPTGRKGLVRDIEIEVTENMVGTTTVPEIGVGATVTTAGNPKFDYARFRLGTAAGTGYATTVNTIRARSECTGKSSTKAPPTLEDFTGHIKLETDFVPADTLFYINFTEGAGGAETGAGRVAVEIDWI